VAGIAQRINSNLKKEEALLGEGLCKMKGANKTQSFVLLALM
jgi:hypothetical protein